MPFGSQPRPRSPLRDEVVAVRRALALEPPEELDQRPHLVTPTRSWRPSEIRSSESTAPAWLTGANRGSNGGYGSIARDRLGGDRRFAGEQVPSQGFRPDAERTFPTFRVTEGNSNAFNAMREMASGARPKGRGIVLLGPKDVGKTHLMMASGDLRHRAHPGSVVFLDASRARPETIAGLNLDLDARPALLVDGMDEIESDPATRGMMSSIIRESIDRGFDVAVSARRPPGEWPPGPLRDQIVQWSTHQLALPTSHDLLAYGRRLAHRTGRMSDEVHLTRLAEGAGTWTAMASALLEQPDLRIQPPSSPPNRTFEETAKGIARAIVEGSEPIAGPELEIEGSLEIRPDPYDPGSAVETHLAARLERDLQDLRSTALEAPTSGVRALDEADVATFLVDDVHRASDTVLARTLSEEIGAGLEARFADRGQTMREQSSRLVRLEAEMNRLAERAPTAGVDELVGIVDRLQAIDEELSGLRASMDEGPSMGPTPAQITVRQRRNPLARLRKRRRQRLEGEEE